MKLTHMAAVSGLALSAFLMTSSAFAQASGTPVTTGNHMDANGMPTNQSTPAEADQTAQLNQNVAANSTTTTDTNNAVYQAQQQQYQNQLQTNQAQQQDYQNRTAAYETLRDRYRAERAAYHRGVWPDRYASWMLENPSSSLVGQRVEILNGDHVGTVREVAHNANRTVEAVLVRLDTGKVVWIDSTDIRYDSAGGILMTNLDRTDLRAMADERL